QKPRALLASAKAVDHPRSHVVDRQKRGGRDASRGKLLEDDSRVDPAEPAAAELVADIDAGEPQLRRAAQRRDREFAALVPPGRLRQPLLTRKRPRRLSKRPLLVRQIEIHEGRYKSGRSGATRGIRWSAIRGTRKSPYLEAI